MPRNLLTCVTLLASFNGASSAWAVTYDWQNSLVGSFLEPSNWSPAIPPGPGGGNDTVNFDLGVVPASRYVVTDVSGENDQLFVHNDSVELNFFPSYNLLSSGGVNPSLVVGAAAGDMADVVLSGADISVLTTRVTRIGNVALSTGVVTAEGLQWAGGNLRVGHAGDGTLVIDDNATVSSTNVSIGHLSGSTGSVYFTGDGSLTTTGNLLIGREGTGSMTVTFNAIVTSAEASIGSEPSGDGIVHLSGQLTAWTINNTLTIGGVGDGELVITSGSITNRDAVVGDLPASDGFVLVSGGNWTSTSRLSIGGETVGGTIGGSGLFRISGGGVTVSENVDVSPNGVLELQQGSLSTRVITVEETTGQFDWTDGVLRVNVFNGDLVNQGGLLLLHADSNNITINGSYTQQDGGALSIFIHGEAATNQYDSLHVSATASLGGELRFSLDAETMLYVPSPDEVYTILEAANLVGSFSNIINGQRVDDGNDLGSFVVNYGPGSPFDPNHVVLSSFQPAGPPGDYNGNGVVDAADYVVWRKNEGTAVPLLNDPIGGTVGQAQYDQWQAHFGPTAGSEALSNNVVPEPPSALLLTLVAMMGCWRRNEFGSQVKLTR